MIINNSIQDSKHNNLKLLIWLYILFWIFEGAIRKWIFPDFSNLFLVVRDPVAICIYILALRNNISFFNGFVGFVYINTLLCFCLTLIYGHQNLFVALYGCRIFLLHFPLIFIIEKVFSQEDIENLGRFLLWLMLPLALLITVQFFSPQSSFVNRGVGGNISGAGFSGVLGYKRPSGTFSMITGLIGLIKLVIVFVLYFITTSKISKWLLYVVVISLIISIPLMISRAMIFNLILALAMFIWLSTSNIQRYMKLIKYTMALTFIFIISLQFDFIRFGFEILMYRFKAAAEVEGSVIEGTLIDRFLGGFIRPFVSLEKYDLFGSYLGMGTNAGSQLLTGEIKFIIGENEWGRILGERGSILGFTLILSRAALVFYIFRKLWINRTQLSFLPWLLFSQTFIAISSGGLNQASNLGALIVFSGLLMACIKNEIHNSTYN